MRIDIKTLEDRDHYVVPMVMITVGVHNGSQGPVFYPADELKRSVPYWNAKPVVVYHPDMYSDGFAGNPRVFNRQKIGYVFNTQFDGHKLKAEAWLDVKRVEQVDNRVSDAIRTKTMMEVSTGLTIQVDDAIGIFTGNNYAHAACNLQPDHLAVLPDRVGACSIADGAGLIRNDQYREEVLGLPTLTW